MPMGTVCAVDQFTQKDPEVVGLAERAGVGGEVHGLLGGKMDSLHGPSMALSGARVAALQEGRYVCKGPMMRGTAFHLGQCAILTIQSGSGTRKRNA